MIQSGYCVVNCGSEKQLGGSTFLGIEKFAIPDSSQLRGAWGFCANRSVVLWMGISALGKVSGGGLFLHPAEYIAKDSNSNQLN